MCVQKRDKWDTGLFQWVFGMCKNFFCGHAPTLWCWYAVVLRCTCRARRGLPSVQFWMGQIKDVLPATLLHSWSWPWGDLLGQSHVTSA